MRRLLFAVMCAALIGTASGCGRQVTGLNSPNQGVDPSGYLRVRFLTVGALDFTNTTYMIVISNSLSSQNYGPPYALGNNSNYLDWSYVITVGGGGTYNNNFTASVGAPQAFQVYVNPATSGYQTYPLTIPSSLLYLGANPSLPAGAGGGFDIVLYRCSFDRPSPTATAPTSSTCPPPIYTNPTWYINLFTVDRNGNAVDSMGSTANPQQDTTFRFTIDTTQLLTGPGQNKVQTNQLSDPGQEIYGFQVFNTP